MKKKELVYAQVLEKAAKGSRSFTQQELARQLGISLSTVNAAVKSLEEIGAVRVKARSAILEDGRKALLYWASHRQFHKDVVYRTRASAPVKEIERSMPSKTVFTAYTGYRLLFKDVPADYGEVYAYVEDVEEIKKRFPFTKGPPNLFVLQKQSFPAQKGAVSLPHLYVDLWNLKEWYAKEFLDALEPKIKDALG